MMPAILLKKMVMGNFDKGYVDSEIADSIDFMVTSVSWYPLKRSISVKKSGSIFIQIETFISKQCLFMKYYTEQALKAYP